MVEIVWTKKAKKQLENSVKYIKKEHGQHYAKIMLNGILEQVEILKIFPRAGQKEPILEYKILKYRYLVKWSYKIIYRITTDEKIAYIVRVFHTSQHSSKMW